MYLSHPEYTAFGGTLPESDFNRFEYRAEKTVDGLTFGRIKNETPTREAVKRFVYEVVALLATYETDGPQISSTSNDGVSESYVTLTEQQLDGKIYSLAITYLSDERDTANVPLVYSGV